MKTHLFSLRMIKSDFDRLSKEAEKEGRSRTNMINEILRQYFIQNKLKKS